jgi:superfamily II RNA helicase
MSEQDNSSFLTVFKTGEPCLNLIPKEELAYEFPYELDSFQKEGIYRIYKNENILITAHTGSGKTVLAIYAIAECVRLNKRVIYTSPTKSLSNQKYAEFIEKFGKDQIGIMTGDIKMNPDAQCIIMTTEILRNILYKESTSDENKIQYSNSIDMKDVGAVILDEVHYINDPDRGKVWEEVIVLVPREITLVMLSATIDKADEFCSWIGRIKEKPIHLIPTSHRVVPLKHYFWKAFPFNDPNKNDKECFRWDLVEMVDEKGKFKNYDIVRNRYNVYDINRIMDNLIDFLVNENYTPALFFKFSRKKCETICKMVRRSLLTFEEISEVENIFHHYMKDYKKTYEIMPQYQDVFAQLKKGVVYHHSGLIPVLKEMIEIIYSKGLVKVLFATETFAIGVNMPTKTVLFSELEKFDNKGRRNLRTDEYLQMSGRAGRRGLDKFGTVIILPTMGLLPELEMKNMFTGKSPSLQSKFSISYAFVLKNMCNFDTFFEKTLIQNEKNKVTNALNEKIISIDEDLEKNKMEEKEYEKMKNYDIIVKKLSDTFFKLAKKDRAKYETEKSKIENEPFFAELKSKYKIYSDLLKEKNSMQDNIYWNNYGTKEITDKMIELLEEEGYMIDGKLSKKGIVATGINECNEILFSEMIFRGLLDDLDFPEIIAILASFINEKDANSINEKYIRELNVPNKVKYVLQEIQKISEYFIIKEDGKVLNLQIDYNMYLDFVELAYLWANGATIHEIYKNTSIYDGNFIKSIMRITNICDNLMDICNTIERFDICKKIENYKEVLIRDITSINSLYIK